MTTHCTTLLHMTICVNLRLGCFSKQTVFRDPSKSPSVGQCQWYLSLSSIQVGVAALPEDVETVPK